MKKLQSKLILQTTVFLFAITVQQKIFAASISWLLLVHNEESEKIILFTISNDYMMTIYKINKMFISIKGLHTLHWSFKIIFIKRCVHYMASSLLMLCCQ